MNFPPTTNQRAGNYADLAHRRAFPTADALEVYDNGFATSAPVMSFTPNPCGLYDMGGNVNEWVDASMGGKHRVLRGGSWEDHSIEGIHSGKRFAALPVMHRASLGFRRVLESDVTPPHPAAISMTSIAASSVNRGRGGRFYPPLLW